MSVFLNLSIDKDYSIPGIKYNEDTGIADVLIPHIDRVLPGNGLAMTANSTASFEHYAVNVATGDVLSRELHQITAFVHIDNVTGVYVPSEDVYIARATLQDRAVIKVYDVSAKSMLEFNASMDNTEQLERYTILLEQHLNQKYGEASENLGFTYLPESENEAGGKTPESLSLVWLHDGISTLVIDNAGIKRYMSKIVDPENGLLVDFIGNLDGHSVFWQRDMGAFLFTRKAKDGSVRLSAIKTDYSTASLIRGGILLGKVTKSGKYRYKAIPLSLIKDAISGGEKALLAELKKSIQVGVNYNAVNCIGSEDVQLVMEKDELGTGVRLSSYSIALGGLNEAGTLPANAMEENFILVKDKYNGIHRIVFKI